MLTHEPQAFDGHQRGFTCAGRLEKRTRTKEHAVSGNSDELEYFFPADHHGLSAWGMDLPHSLHPAAVPVLSGADGL